MLNTEYRKCHHITEQDITDPQNLPSYSEEDLLDMMNFAQVIVSLSKCMTFLSTLDVIVRYRNLVYKLILTAFCITVLVQGNKKLQTFCHICSRLP